ncbi:MAG: ATP-binding protein [Clostridia bacterium]|nr:ATP-binding protein [Clostridia bacterium]
MYFEIDNFNALERALHEMWRRLEAMKVPEQSLFDSKLVASELLNNVLLHGGERAIFSALLDGEVIRIRVQGNNRYCPPESSECSDVYAESGRGLFLVDALCESRSYSDSEGISVVIRIVEK